MTAGKVPLPRGRMAWPHRVSIAATILLFVIVNTVAFFDALRLREKNRQVLDDMFASVELVSRLGRDVDHERLLLDAHIFEVPGTGMEQVEKQLAEVELDYETNARAYDRVADLPGETQTWSGVKDARAALRAPIRRVLELSRRNQDRAAREALVDLDGRFDAIEQNFDRLREINRAGAVQTIEKTRTAGRTWLVFLGVATFLGAALTTMIARLSARTISRREDEVREMTKRLEDQNDELDAFAGRVAHDLRGPLTTIGLATARLSPTSDGAVGPLLKRSVKRMDELIRDLLALARVEALPRDAECDPSTVAESVQEDLATRLASDGDVVSSVEPATVRCSDGLLHQVLWNLTENSLKFRRAEEPAHLSIRGRALDGTYDLSVSDNGVGMTADEARHAFEPFFRAQRTHATAGTGLGLTIVRRIVEACGGRISVDSHVGIGTTIVLHLPLVLASSPAPSSA